MQWGASLGLALVAACSVPPPFEWGGPRPVREVERWEARSEGGRVGEVLLLEIQNPDGVVRFYQVQNGRGQWLGYIDDQGRVYQRVPFSMTETFRGILPMEKALALLYEEPGRIWLSSAGSRSAGSAAAKGR